MDQQLREAERQYRADPKNDNHLRQLVHNRRRSGYVLRTAEDFALDQKEIRLRYKEVNSEILQARKHFDAFIVRLFEEFSELERFLLRTWVPAFMDGDALRPSWSIAVHPRHYANEGLIPHTDVYENWDEAMWVPGMESKLIRRTSCMNGKLSDDDCEKISNYLWSYSELMVDMFGMNIELNIYRDSGPLVEDNSDLIRHWKIGNDITLKITSFDPGY